MSWFGQYFGTAYTGQWWGDAGPQPPQPPATGGAVYTGGWEDYLARRIRNDEWREEVAEALSAKPPPKAVQEAALEVAEEWLSGDYADADAAQEELRKIAALRSWIWDALYGDLLNAYRDALERERRDYYGQLVLARLEADRKKRQAAAMLFLLAQV